MKEVWNHRGNVPGRHPAGHWICHAFLQPLLTFRSIEFYFWMLSSFYKNPIRALECPLPLHSVAQPRDKEAGLSVCNQITSLPGPQLRTGNLKFLASLQFPNPSLQSPWAFLHDLAVSALQTGLTQLTASVLSAYSVKGSERSQDVLDPERPRCPDASLSSGGALLPIFFNEARSFLTRYFVHLIYFCWCFVWGGILFWPQPGKFERRSLNQTCGESHSDWLFKTISTWLSQWLQHKSDLLSVTNDLSRESLIQIPDDSKQHLSKSSCSTLEPTTISTLPLSPSKLTTSCAPNMHARVHTRLIDLRVHLWHL